MNSYPELEINGAKLLSVPAVHYRMVFAEHVNAICRTPGTRPDAIAVELGPQSAVAVASWLRELCAQGSKMPCMLSLTRLNRRVNPAYESLARMLQESTGKDLNDISLDTLKRCLNYSSVSVLPLSPVDSIIEAVRCAVELDIPLYGVDIEETAEVNRKECIIQDPISARGERFLDYVNLNQSIAKGCRDDGPENIDCKREYAMAARLKTVMKNHKKVLFTCGLAHWSEIERLMKDDSIKAAPLKDIKEQDCGDFMRCIMHPLLAVNYMDIFPAFASTYIDRRRTARKLFDYFGNERSIPDPSALLRAGLMDTCNSFFEQGGNLERGYMHRLPGFIQLLQNLCLVRRQIVPNILTLIETSACTMGEEFSRALAKTFLDYPWASPREFPGLAVLAPTPDKSYNYRKVEYIFPDGKTSKPFYFNLLNERSGVKAGVAIPWEWDKCHSSNNGNEKVSMSSKLRTWPPRDYLISSMSLEAMDLAGWVNSGKNSVEFNGSMLEGIDMKSTMRAFIRGEESIHVYESIDEIDALCTMDTMDPVVWLIDPFDADDALDWELYNADFDRIRPFIKDEDYFAMCEQGSDFLCAAYYGKMESTDPASYAKGVKYNISMKGIVYFVPPHFDIIQEAKFVDKYKGSRLPIYNGTKHSLFEMFAADKKIDLDLEDWSTSMIRMAIPFARKKVTVVLPDGLKVSSLVINEAKKAGKEVRIARLSNFPQKKIKELSTNFAISTIASSKAEELPASAVKFMGENVNNNMELLPDWLLNFGKGDCLSSN